MDQPTPTQPQPKADGPLAQAAPVEPQAPATPPEKPIEPTAPVQPAQPSQPTQPIEPTKKGNSMKKMMWAFLAIIVLGLVAGVSYYMGMQKGESSQLQALMEKTKENLAKQAQPTNTPKLSPTPDPTASWSAYTNTNLKYSLKYPSTFSPNETKVVGYTFFGNQIYVYTSNTDPLQCKGDCSVILATSAATINGMKGTYVEAKQGSVGGNVPGPMLWYEFLQNGTYYVFTYQTQALGSAPDEKNIFNQMAQTFKLTK
ncbi:MAG TPA: hypothetical protein VEW42_04730 [Candidatus Eisenbacteria bacterium]|nr:hypothetical protein [Candidatus Eisenbacteria bacterium]